MSEAEEYEGCEGGGEEGVGGAEGVDEEEE